MIAMTTLSNTLIDTDTALKEFCQHLSTAEWLSVDTEFLRTDTFYPKLCLIQIATADKIACVDAIALTNLQPLFKALNTEQPKIFHSASQDLEIFYYLAKFIPQPLFDTQILANIAGLGQQLSYANLTQKLLNITLDKSQTRTNWEKRPLSLAQHHYACNDVRYLYPLYQKLAQQIQTSEQQQQQADAHTKLCNSKQYQVIPELAWKRIRAIHKLPQSQKVLAKSLAKWRENEAKQKNRPRRWILSDKALLSLATLENTAMSSLVNNGKISHKMLTRYGEQWQKLLNE